MMLECSKEEVAGAGEAPAVRVVSSDLSRTGGVLDRRACAEQVGITICCKCGLVKNETRKRTWSKLTIVYTANRWPELLLEKIWQRVGCLLTRVRSIPLALRIAEDQVSLRVRGVLEHIALLGLLALLNLTNLVADANHGINEAIQLLLALTLGRLNHERVRHRPAHSRGVESVVLETLRDIDSLDAGGLLEGAGVDDELVSAATLVVSVEDGVVVLEAGQDVVGVEKSNSGSLAQTLVACRYRSLADSFFKSIRLGKGYNNIPMVEM